MERLEVPSTSPVKHNWEGCLRLFLAGVPVIFAIIRIWDGEWVCMLQPDFWLVEETILFQFLLQSNDELE